MFHIDYLTDFHIDCEKAIYQEASLTATGKKLSSLTHFGDCVDAKRIHLDLQTKLLTLDSPQGKLSSLFFPEEPDRKCQFASHVLTWDHQEHRLFLKGGVVIYDPLLGTLIGENIFFPENKKENLRKNETISID